MTNDGMDTLHNPHARYLQFQCQRPNVDKRRLIRWSTLCHCEIPPPCRSTQITQKISNRENLFPNLPRPQEVKALHLFDSNVFTVCDAVPPIGIWWWISNCCSFHIGIAFLLIRLPRSSSSCDFQRFLSVLKVNFYCFRCSSIQCAELFFGIALYTSIPRILCLIHTIIIIN